MQGGKGGSKTSTVEIPQWAQDLMRENLQRAEAQSRMGYVPFMGVDVAGLGPTGDLARQANVDAAIAYGFAPEGTKVAPSKDLRSYDLYTQQLAEARKAMPGAMNYYDQFFIDPVTGAAPLYDQARIAAAAAEEARRSGRIPPVLYDTREGNSDTVNAQPYGGSQFGRDIGFGLMSSPNPIANLAGYAITGAELDAITRSFNDLPTATGGSDNNGSNYSGSSDTYGGADAGTGDDDQWD